MLNIRFRFVLGRSLRQRLFAYLAVSIVYHGSVFSVASQDPTALV